MIPNWQKSILKEIITAFGWKTVVGKVDKRLLDVGCGIGRVTIELAKLGVMAVGIDIEKSGVRKASRFATLNRCQNTSFVLASAEQLPFREHSFTHVIAIHTMDYVRNDRKAFKELSRVMGKNGLLLIRSPNAYGNMFWLLVAIYKLFNTDRRQGNLRHYDPETDGRGMVFSAVFRKL
jgi:ubiquinone/menaquinone biosynthesis C-methylase UbiE